MNRFLPIVILIPLTAACTRPAAPLAATTTATQTASSGQFETLAVSPVVDTYRASGTVRARETAAVAAKIVAEILDVRVKSGDRVEAGQLLIVLDRRDLEANLRRAEAARTESENVAAETENAIAAAKANLDLARVTHKRFEGLLMEAAVSQQEFDESLARLKNAEAALEMAASRRRQADARRSQADAELAAQRVALGYATLAAPFAGLVIERKADPGSLATPGMPLLILEREGFLRLETSIDESRLSLIRIGEEVAVEIDGLNRTFNGRVAEITPSIDPFTRSFIAKINLPAVPELRAGMFGRATFNGGQREALMVPDTAVLERGQIRSVYVLEQDVARLRLVTVGETHDNRREILSGLTTGEKIIVAPPPLLSDGSRLVMQEAK
jgi:multidrug efflux pump subunit AcrA (membrane-fusion protein)